ncbi:MAG: ABC transporter substrate-binding protein [Clostridia bacterium]
MKKLIAFTLACALVLAMVGGCAAPSTPGTDTPADNANADASSSGAGETIKIGLNYELSGDYAMYGLACNAGAEMALNEVNEAGGVNGKKLELVKYDNKCDPAEAATLATKLMTVDKVVAEIGPALTGTFSSVSSVAENNKVPVITGSATGDNLIAEHNEDGTVKSHKNYTFRICFNDSFQGVTMANFAANDLGAKKVAIYADSSNDYAKGLEKSFVATFPGEIVAQEYYAAGDTDFNAVLTSLAGKEFDALFIPGYFSEVGLIIKQARMLGIDCPVIGADGFESEKLVELAGAENLNNVYYSSHYSSLLADPKIDTFVKNYTEKYNESPNMFHAMGYDAAMFLVDAITRAMAQSGEATVTPDQIQAALISTTEFSGVTGSFAIDPESHDTVKAIVVVELQNGVAVSAKKIG